MKRKSCEGGLDDAVNMDVMMDNMTDVVGTLLMVLVIVQLQVNNAVDTIQSNLPEVTQEELAAKKSRLDELEAEAERVEAVSEISEEEARRMEADVARKRADLRRFETTAVQDSATLMAVEKVRAELEAKKREVDKEKAAMAALIAERDRLAGLLDGTKPVEAPADKVVRIPEAREIPKGATMVDVVCHGERVYVADLDAFEKKALAAVFAKRQKLLREVTTDPKGREIPVFDHLKTTELLGELDLGNQLFTLKFPVIKTATSLRLEAHPTEKAGEDPFKAGSAYRRLLSALKKAGGVVWFKVMPDALETYLAAREICDKQGVPAGWEMTGTPFFVTTLPDLRVNQLEQPPPPGPPPADGIVIPAPKRTLD